MANEPKSVADLAAKNESLRQEVAKLTVAQGGVAKGDVDVTPLNKGDFVWYVRPLESVPRPGVILSDGIYERRKLPNGHEQQFAHIAYGTTEPEHVLLGHESPKPLSNDPDDKARVVAQRQTHETTAAWDPTGQPGTWHLDGECEHLQHPKIVGGDTPQAS